jgi:hypothetical protein
MKGLLKLAAFLDGGGGASESWFHDHFDLQQAA